MSILLFFIAVWYLSLFSQSFFLHRYASHSAFKMNKFWERFFFIFTYLAQGSHYMSPRAYAILHRLHHAHTDTELDPHSPSFSSNIFSMMWRTRNMYNDIIQGQNNCRRTLSQKPASVARFRPLGWLYFVPAHYGQAFTFLSSFTMPHLPGSIFCCL
jgi:fatty-acid desaturase